MQDRCKTCGKELDEPCLTHCSDKCLFATIWNSESIGSNPIETWDDNDPWK